MKSYVRLVRDIHRESKEPRAPEFSWNFDAHLVRALSRESKKARIKELSLRSFIGNIPNPKNSTHSEISKTLKSPTKNPKILKVLGLSQPRHAYFTFFFF